MASEYRVGIVPYRNRSGRVERIAYGQVLSHLLPGDLVICRRKATLARLAGELVGNLLEVDFGHEGNKDFISDLRKLFLHSELSDRLLEKRPKLFLDEVRRRNVKRFRRESKKMGDPAKGREFLGDATVYLDERLAFVRQCLRMDGGLMTVKDILAHARRLLSWKNGNAVRLSTIHGAKGLEAERVFILDHDLLPLQRRGQREWEARQENNLAYVALTRTKHTLFLVNSD